MRDAVTLVLYPATDSFVLAIRFQTVAVSSCYVRPKLNWNSRQILTKFCIYFVPLYKILHSYVNTRT
jgi:hypothetical protein